MPTDQDRGQHANWLVPVVHVLGHAIENPINAEAVKGALAPVAVFWIFIRKIERSGAWRWVSGKTEP